MNIGNLRTENGSGSSRGKASTFWTLDDLARMDAPELRRVYANGAPPGLSDLDGAPRGRMLAFVGPLGRGPAFEALRRVARAPYFPWAGKSFRSKDEGHGAGINRVRGLGDWFAFDTRVGPSALDGKPCLILDYDLPKNPWIIRQIHDELREVSPKLFLGPAMWKTRRAAKLVLFFAIAP